MKLTAKDFAAKTGFPLKLIRRMCRTGQLEHWQIGRVYWLDEHKAAATMELYKATPIYTPKEQDRCRIIKRLPDKFPLGVFYHERKRITKPVFSAVYR